MIAHGWAAGLERAGQAAGIVSWRARQWAVLIAGGPGRVGVPASARQVVRTCPLLPARWARSAGGRRERVHAGQVLVGDADRSQRDDQRQQADRRADQEPGRQADRFEVLSLLGTHRGSPFGWCWFEISRIELTSLEACSDRARIQPDTGIPLDFLIGIEQPSCGLVSVEPVA